MPTPRSENITYHHAIITPEAREAACGQRGCVLWFTGLSGSGKSTIAREVEAQLLHRHVHAYVLDGDNIRFGLNRDLGFSDADRVENLRRVGEVARLFAEACTITITAFISPFRESRDSVRRLLPEGRFMEVFIDTPLELCEARDPKGLYAKARAGQIPDFTGISSPYEAPDAPEIHVLTAGVSVSECAAQVVSYLEAQGFLSVVGPE